MPGFFPPCNAYLAIGDDEAAEEGGIDLGLQLDVLGASHLLELLGDHELLLILKLDSRGDSGNLMEEGEWVAATRRVRLGLQEVLGNLPQGIQLRACPLLSECDTCPTTFLSLTLSTPRNCGLSDGERCRCRATAGLNALLKNMLPYPKRNPS